MDGAKVLHLILLLLMYHYLLTHPENKVVIKAEKECKERIESFLIFINIPSIKLLSLYNMKNLENVTFINFL